ncbi:hypothetical protein BO219_13555 [Anoxybacillus kestanbolensis]|uniref:O-antigen translocase n=1 Tax=Anoxybacillus kestanbolensis TaxID=227476 RepID=A0A1V3FFD9_9BACL|nr:O-antigen translocase [Anoxybacillus kestanbolensis]OOE00231.1 hypothetical protein BO219_13555 [Anoxybacillus kestanbolensis]
MSLIKTTLLSGIATVIRMLSGMVVNKVIAVYIGPSGLAMIGNFQNVLNTFVTLSTGGINSGITKYVAEFNGDPKKRNEYLQASFFITLISSLMISLIIIVFKEWFSLKILHSLNYTSIFIVLSITIFFIGLNNYMLAVLNGLKYIRIYIFANILASLSSLVLTTFLTTQFGLYGAILSLVLVHSVALMITVLYLLKKKDIKFNFFLLNVPRRVYVNLLKFSLMSAVSIVTVPLVQLIIRGLIANQVSLESAGYWEALNRVSNMYLLIITTSLTTYYLPRLSEIKNANELQREVIRGYKLILPVVGIILISVYLLKDWIVRILFTNEFQAMSDLFPLQLLGDFLKMSSWILAYLMVAKALTRFFIFSEIISGATYLLFSYLFINSLGVKGVILAYCLMYAIYMVLMVFMYFRVLRVME